MELAVDRQPLDAVIAVLAASAVRRARRRIRVTAVASGKCLRLANWHVKRGFLHARRRIDGMSVLSDHRLRWLSVAAVLVVLASVGVAGVGTLAVLSAVASVSAGESLLLAFLQAAVPFLLALATLSVLGVALLAWLVVRAVRLAEVPRSDRLETVARRVERRVPWLEDGLVADRVAPTVADRRDALAERYANGELSERELERKLERLLDEHGDPATDWSTTTFDDEFDRDLAAELDRENGFDRDPSDELSREGGVDRDPSDERSREGGVDRDPSGESSVERERR
jgi:ABC-type multidrug transport system fused ATPase/permease subunit